MNLDLAAIRLFLLAVDLGNLTRAAEAANTVQPVVSQKLKALEADLGRRLLDRTSRFVRPTAEGLAFLPHARALIAAHDVAARFTDPEPPPLTVAVSDHALGIRLEDVLRRLRASLPPGTALTLRTGFSQAARAAFEAGEADAAIIRHERGATEGERLGTDPILWRAAEHFTRSPNAPLPLATLGTPCGVRGAAIRALDAAGVAWREAFVAGSCAALLAGVRAGLGIAPMGRAAAGEMPDRGPALGLPVLPASDIVLLGRAGSPAMAASLLTLAASVKASLA